MSEPKSARPPQVTIAGWLVVAGSVVAVLMAFDQVADLRSLETRESVEEYLSKPPGDSLGIGVQGVLSLLQVAYMVAAACAAATAILGWQVLQRSKGARLALSILVVPLFFTGLASGGIASAVVAAAVVMLWFQPARDWFDGIARSPSTRTPAASDPPSAASPGAPPPAGRDPLLDLPPPTSPPLHPTPYAAAPAPAVHPARDLSRDRRPTAVTWACVLTWVFSGAAFALLAVTLGVVLAAPGTLLEEMHRQNPDLADQGLSDATLKATVYATSAVVMAWSAAAIVLAVLVWRRVRWAAIALAVSAGVAGALCLLTVIGSLLLLVPLASCAMTVALLLRTESRRWYGAGRSQ
jgi:hypothetical protein